MLFIDKRKLSEPGSGPYTGSNGSRHKIMEMYLVCPKCKDRYVPKEIYMWVRPEKSDIYQAIHSSLHDNSIIESIYEMPRNQVEDTFASNTTSPEESKQQILSQAERNIRTREPLPLPLAFRDSRKESLATGSGNILPGSSGKISKSPVALSDCRTAHANEEGNTVSPSPGSRSSEEYIDMAGKKDKSELVHKRLSLPCSLSSSHTSNGPLCFLSPEGSSSVKSSLSGSFEEVFSDGEGPRKGMIPPETSTPYLNVESNKYTPEPVISGGKRHSQSTRDHGDADTNSVASGGSFQTRLSGIREGDSERQKRNSLTVGLSKFLQSKYSMESLVFVADV